MLYKDTRVVNGFQRKSRVRQSCKTLAIQPCFQRHILHTYMYMHMHTNTYTATEAT